VLLEKLETISPADMVVFMNINNDQKKDLLLTGLTNLKNLDMNSNEVERFYETLLSLVLMMIMMMMAMMMTMKFMDDTTSPQPLQTNYLAYWQTASLEQSAVLFIDQFWDQFSHKSNQLFVFKLYAKSNSTLHGKT
jgi:hypothetical protein